MGSNSIRYSFAFIPLALCGNFANHLRYVPGGAGLTVQLTRFPFGGSAVSSSEILVTVNLIWAVQIALAIVGIAWAFCVLYKINATELPAGAQNDPRILSYHLILLSIYGALYLWLFTSLRGLM